MTVIEQIELFAANYPKTFALITAVIVLLLQQLWTRYKNRVSTLAWTVNHSRYAASWDHPMVGSIAVTVNGSKARTLFFTDVVVTNTSTRDLTDLDVDFELPARSTIVAAEGAVDKSLSGLLTTERFDKVGEAAKARWKEETADAEALRARVTTWRAFRIPALNRQTSASFRFLWENDATVAPVIAASCTHAGVRMAFKKQLARPSPFLFGVPLHIAAAVGIVAGSALVLAFAPSWLYFLPFALGILVAVLGAGIALAGRMLAKLFG